MKKQDISGFPPLVENLEALHEEMDKALRRTWLMLGAVVLPCSGLVLYTLGMTRVIN